MEAKFDVRPAVATDLDRVLALDRITESLPHWSAAEYRTILEQAAAFPTWGLRRRLFVAETAVGLAGFAVCRVTVIQAEYRTEVLAELESVAVAIGSRRSGVGRALCRAVIDWSIGLGAAGIDLEVRRRSEGAIAFYTQLGFASVGRRANYYQNPKDDAILMRLEAGTGRGGMPSR